MPNRFQFIRGDLLVSVVLTSIILVACGESQTREPEAEQPLADGKAETAKTTTAREEAARLAYKQANEVFVTQNLKREGWTATESGLQIFYRQAGGGASALPGQFVRVNYSFSLIDGTVVESNQDEGQPIIFPVNGLFPGWVEAMSLLKEGDQVNMLVPAHLAYGARERTGIPAWSVLIFDVDLLEVLSLEEVQAEVAAGKQAFQDRQRVYLEANAKKVGVTVTESGLQYEILRSGPADGLKPLKTSKVEVQYQGQLIDGRVIDTTYDEEGKTRFFHPTQVIPGWEEALLLMRPGDQWRITIPHTLGYGVAGYGKRVPPLATLVFEVDLLEVYNGVTGIPSREWMRMQAEKAAAETKEPQD